MNLRSTLDEAVQSLPEAQAKLRLHTLKKEATNTHSRSLQVLSEQPDGQNEYTKLGKLYSHLCGHYKLVILVAIVPSTVLF